MSTDQQQRMATFIHLIVMTMDTNVRHRGWFHFLKQLDDRMQTDYARASMIMRDKMSGEVSDMFQVINMGIGAIMAHIDIGTFRRISGTTQKQLMNDIAHFDRAYRSIREDWLEEFNKFINKMKSGEINVD